MTSSGSNNEQRELSGVAAGADRVVREVIGGQSTSESADKGGTRTAAGAAGAVNGLLGKPKSTNLGVQVGSAVLPGGDKASLGGGNPGAGGGGGAGGPGGGGTPSTVIFDPRTDFSVALAGLADFRKNRAPWRSNNFVSMIGGVGGLGRAGSQSRRSLLGSIT
jgi:hypothetical protein